MVLHLITGADGSINGTSVGATAVCPEQVFTVCATLYVSRPSHVPVSFHLSVFPPASVCSLQLESDCLDINYIVVSNCLPQQATQERQTRHCFQQCLKDALHIFQLAFFGGNHGDLP